MLQQQAQDGLKKFSMPLLVLTSEEIRQAAHKEDADIKAKMMADLLPSGNEDTSLLHQRIGGYESEYICEYRQILRPYDENYREDKTLPGYMQWNDIRKQFVKRVDLKLYREVTRKCKDGSMRSFFIPNIPRNYFPLFGNRMITIGKLIEKMCGFREIDMDQERARKNIQGFRDGKVSFETFERSVISILSKLAGCGTTLAHFQW
jgi:hypothetical protein